MYVCIAQPTQLHVMNLWYKQINFSNLKIQNQLKSGSFHPFVVPPRVLPQISNAEPRSEALRSGSGGSGVNDWGRFVNRAKHWYVHGFTCPPSGSIISYQGMRSVCLHSVGLCVCAPWLVQICLSLPLLRPDPGGDHLFVLSWHPLLLTIPKRPIFPGNIKRYEMAFQNTVSAFFNTENSPFFLLVLVNSRWTCLCICRRGRRRTKTHRLQEGPMSAHCLSVLQHEDHTQPKRCPYEFLSTLHLGASANRVQTPPPSSPCAFTTPFSQR